MAAALPEGTVRLRTAVTAIRTHSQGSGGLEVDTSSGTLRARHVVLALPPALALERIDFRHALPADLVRLARSTPVWMGAVAKVVARYPAAFWRNDGLAGAAFSRTGPLQEIHDMSGPGGTPAALFGFAHARAVGPGFEHRSAHPQQRHLPEPIGMISFMDNHFDLVVIGSGSGNAIVDKRFADWKVAIVEKGVGTLNSFGGTVWAPRW
ncbi:FAD-dependent oxidoreductase [Streptomyces sp. NPDC014006]|uniref:FAD-dependent oxidoreductase n=1 Tax=Streptomyces sp. NPDC014006 TaxID=3364870 RepID=UPI0036FE389E